MYLVEKKAKEDLQANLAGLLGLSGGGRAKPAGQRRDTEK